MSPSMSCEIPLQFVSFVALVALEGSLHHVRSRVVFQMVRLGGSKVALVTSDGFCSPCLLLLFYIHIDSNGEAFHQSVPFCAFAGGLIVLFYIRIDCSDMFFPRCAS